MNYFYTSHWQRKPHSLRLTGVLAVGEGSQAGAFFPDAPDEQADWEDVIAGIPQTPAESRLTERFRSITRRFYKDSAPLQARRSRTALLGWLRQTAAGGNGITEDFDEVRSITADSLEDALHQAFRATLEHYGGVEILEGPARKGVSTHHSDSTAGLWPEGFLRPQEQEKARSGKG